MDSTEVSTKITPQQDFEKNIKDRLRSSIGDLMPDEVLAEMVKKVIEETFLKPPGEKDRYGDWKQTGESWFITEVRQLSTQLIRETLTKYFETNKEQLIKDAGEQIVKEVPILLGKFLFDLFASNSYNVASQISAKMTTRGY